MSKKDHYGLAFKTALDEIAKYKEDTLEYDIAWLNYKVVSLRETRGYVSGTEAADNDADISSYVRRHGRKNSSLQMRAYSMRRRFHEASRKQAVEIILKYPTNLQALTKALSAIVYAELGRCNNPFPKKKPAARAPR